MAIFKQLHATRKNLYCGDEPNLAKARAKINEEFRNHKVVAKEDEIPELIGIAKEVELYYRTNVVQAFKVADDKHSMEHFHINHIANIEQSHFNTRFCFKNFVGIIIRGDTHKLDNKEFDENAKLPKIGRGAKCGSKKVN